MYGLRRFWAPPTCLKTRLVLAGLLFLAASPMAGAQEPSPADATDAEITPWTAPAEAPPEGFQPIESSQASPRVAITAPPRQPALPPEQEQYINDIIRGTARELAADADNSGFTPPTGEESPSPRDDFGLSYYLRAFAAMCLVLALIVLAGYAARRFAGKSPLLAGNQLGQVLGRIHLAKGASLQFVRTGGRVLVVGLTNANISLVAEFDESAFDGFRAAGDETEPAGAADEFLNQLRASSASIDFEGVTADDDEIASLRGDIQRLQQYLQEETRHPRD